MKKIKYYIIPFYILFFCACSSSIGKSPDEIMNEFLVAWKSEDLKKMITLYPDVSLMEIIYASDTSYIENIYQVKDDVFKAKVKNSFINKKGISQVKDFIFIIKKQSNKLNLKSYLISDSYGFCNWDKYPYYTFAIKTGCLKNKIELSDVQHYKRMVVAKELLFDTAKNMYLNLTDNINIESSKMTDGENGLIKGEAIIRNNSEFTLPDLKYIIYFFDKDKKMIAKDSGWVTKNMFDSGKKINFSFVTAKVKGASDASFELDFDLSLILDFVMTDNIYNGTEYEKFLKKSMSGKEIV